MVAVSLLLLAVSLSFVFVRIGAVALELTGMPWDQAKFQALSAFSNAGFTTRESETITRHPVRRRIASYLIVLGNAGLVTAVGGFASSLIDPNPARSLINVGAITAGMWFLIWLGRKPKLTERLRVAARRWLSNRGGWDAATEAELLRLQDGYVLTRIDMTHESHACDHKLSQLSLKEHQVQVLSIERDGHFIPAPGGNDMVRAGDGLVVYGAEAHVNRLFRGNPSRSLILGPEEARRALGDLALNSSPDKDQVE